MPMCEYKTVRYTCRSVDCILPLVVKCQGELLFLKHFSFYTVNRQFISFSFKLIWQARLYLPHSYHSLFHSHLTFAVVTFNIISSYLYPVCLHYAPLYQPPFWSIHTVIKSEQPVQPFPLSAVIPVSNLFTPVTDAMVTRSQSTVGCRALPVGAPSSTFQLLLIVCGSLLDVEGQGKNLVFYWPSIFLVTAQLQLYLRPQVKSCLLIEHI